MSVTLFVHAGGSPGATVTALACALNWPAEVLLADCDPHASQTVVAGYLNARSTHGVGLAAFAAAVRTGNLNDDQLRTDALQLPGARRRAMFYPGFSHPSSAEIFTPLWPDLAEQFRALSASGTDILVDLGRLSARPVPSPLLASADQLLLVTRSDLPSLAAVRIWLPELRASVLASNQALRVGLVVVGAGMPYSSRELTRQFDLPTIGEIAWDPKDAALLREGKALPRGFDRRPLPKSAQQLAHRLFTSSMNFEPTGGAASQVLS